MSELRRRLEFTHNTPAQRVLFGSGLVATHLAAEVRRMQATRPMVIAAGNLAIVKRMTRLIDPVVHFDEVVEHVPTAVAERARSVARRSRADVLVPIGGGSTVGLAKAVAMTTRIPIVAIPTTYAGSEATDVWGLTEHDRKTTGIDPGVLPVSVIYDAELTLSLPRALSVASGINAMAHCIDSFWAPRADPINATLAAEGLRALAAALPVLATDPDDLPGREQAQYACYLAAAAFASAGAGMHHKICHTLGGAFALPHAATHAVVLPHVLAFNAPNAQDAVSRVAKALGVADGPARLVELLDSVGAPRSLQELGLLESEVAHAAVLALPAIPSSNPRRVDLEDLTNVLHAAWTGERG